MTTPTEEQRQAARRFHGATRPTGSETNQLAALFAAREAELLARAERAERDYRIVEAAIRSFGFPVVEAEAAAAAIRKLGEERDEARRDLANERMACAADLGMDVPA